MVAGVQTALHQVTKIEIKKSRSILKSGSYKFYETVHVIFHYRDGTYDVTAFAPMEHEVEITNDPR